MDGRDEPGHDGEGTECAAARSTSSPTARTARSTSASPTYLGVTNDLARRIYEHRSLRTPGFTQRYGLTRLVWYELYEDIRDAIQRERTMKHWSRAWKVRLILDVNPNWTDLYDEMVH